MRQLLLLLLLLNGAFYLWETRLRAQFDALPATDETAGKLDSIVLIAELPPVPDIKVIDPEPTPQPAARPSAPLTSYTPSPSVKALLHPPRKPVAPPSQPTAAETKPPSGTNAVTDNKTPTLEPAKATPAATKPVLAEEPVAAPTKPAEPAPQCRRIGPFPSEADATSLRLRLAGSGTVSVEHKSSKAELGYWVLYPAAATLEQARTNKRTLIAKGAKDAAVLVDGDNALSVSLGFFKERAGAEKTLAEARAKGIDVNLKARLEQRDEYWLKLQTKAAAGSDSAWQAWQKEHPGTPARTGACP